MPTVLSETATETVVQTDDGRVLTLPKAFAAQYGLGTIAPPSLPFVSPGMQPPTPEPRVEPPTFSTPQPAAALADGAIPGVPQVASPPPAQQIDTPAPPPPPAPLEPAAPAPPAAPPIAPAPAPAGNPFQQAAALQQSGFGLQEQAVIDTAVADQRKFAEVAAAREASNAKAAEIQAARQKQAEADLAERARMEREYGDAVKAYGSHKIESKSPPVGALIFAALSGIGSALKGEGQRNPALDIIMAKQAESIQLQMAEREKLGQSIQLYGQKADRFGRLAGDRAAEYHLRLAGEQEKLAQEIALIGERSNSETVKARAEAGIGQIRVAQGENLSLAADKEFGRITSERQLAEQRAARAAAAAQAKADRIESSRRFDLERQDKALDRNLKAGQLDLDTAKAMAAMSKEQRDQQGKEGAYNFNGDPLVNKDGTPFLAGNEARATAIQNKVSNVKTMADLTDEVIRLREKHGWSSDLARSPEWQQMKANFASMQLTEKDVRELGAITGSDLTLLSNALGTDDPTGMRDPTPGLRQYRKNAEAGLNNHLQSVGYRGEPLKIPSLTSSSFKTADDSEAGKLYEAAITGPDRPQPVGGAVSRRDRATNEADADEAAAARAEGNTPITEAQRAAMGGLEVLAKTRGPDGKEALKTLVRLYTTDKRERLRAAAGNHLRALGVDPENEDDLRLIAGSE
jgi:hypothetical protein